MQQHLSPPGAGTQPRNKVVTADQAVRLIKDGDNVVVGGFIGQGFAEELTLALERRFLKSGSPRDLGLVFTVAQGDRQGRGLDRLCHEGLIDRAVGAHFGMAPALQKMAVDGAITAHNLPQGVITHLYRETAGARPGLLTKVGLGTFVDPRHGGGKINDRTSEERVRLMDIDGEEYLFYKAFDALDVAFLRGTTADPEGNITMEREAVTLEALPAATAVHNRGGLVIVQVERLAATGALNPRDVKIPGILVDCVVLSTPERHWQTTGTPYSPAFSAELPRVALSSVPPLGLDGRKVIARRAAMELRPNWVVNLGIGMPEGVASVAAEEHVLDYLTLTAESGVTGGLPIGGLDFGAAVNAHAVVDQPAQFDFYDGGGLDAAFLGMAQTDGHGNVNVSRFGSRLTGSGGFINISQNAQHLFFLGTFLTSSRSQVRDGKLVICETPKAPKFVTEVNQRTFSGSYATASEQPVLYITERCVFELAPEGLRLAEVAPGVDVERDVLAHLGFTPVLDREPTLMDLRIFVDGPMNLRRDLLEVPLEDRCVHDAARSVFFVNLEGLSINRRAELDALEELLRTRLTAVGRRVPLVVNYDNFHLSEVVEDEYAAFQRRTAELCSTVTRYSTSSFLRLRFRARFARSGITPHLHASKGAALAAAHT